MNRKPTVFVMALTLGMTGSVRAHHNMTALFDFSNKVTLSGTLSRIDWRNPHIYLFMDVTSDAESGQTWSIEGPPPSFFRLRDVDRSMIEAAIGKTVNVEASRARDGSRAGLLRVITLPGGKVVSACPQNC